MNKIKKNTYPFKWSQLNLLGGCILILLGNFSCSYRAQEKEKSLEDRRVIQQQVEPQVLFPYPEIPAMLIRPDERETYLVVHYWDNFNFADTLLINNKNVTEQGVADYLAILGKGTVKGEDLKESLENFCNRLEQQAHARKVLLQIMENYLYNPNSPFYDEELYALFLERMINSKYVDAVRKSSLQFRLQLIKRNTPGHKATDFVYYLPDGSKCTLYQTKIRGNRLLLVFYDPECSSCHEVMQEMVRDNLLKQAVETGYLTVLAIYTEGNLEVWKHTLDKLPEEWIVGCDREVIKEHTLYDLKAMPSLYLLDADKIVLLKDASYNKICRELQD